MTEQDFTEFSLIEQPAIALFYELGWDIANCYEETYGAQGTLGRETSTEVLLLSRIYSVLERLNPDLPTETYQLAIEELSRNRSMMSPSHANREVYQLLKGGVKVAFGNEYGVDFEAKKKFARAKANWGFSGALRAEESPVR